MTNGGPPVELAGRLAHEDKFRWFTRIGFVGRGLLYIVIGLLVVGTGRTEDLTGALEYVGDGPGKFLLVIIAAGMVTYGFWRLADALFGVENLGDGWTARRKRVVAAFIGFIYLYLGYKAVRLMFAGGERALSVQQQADTVLDLPGGRWVLAFAALVLLAAGINQFREAGPCKFMHRLTEGAGSQAWIKWFGRLGYAARGVIFLLVGFLVGRAAVDEKSTEAGGMEQALDMLSGPLLYAVAGGLILFGAFSIVEARFRRLHRLPVEKIKREVGEAVGA